MNKTYFDLITSLSLDDYPFFEDYPWESSHNHVNKFIRFCQSVGVQYVYTASKIFPRSLHGQERQWYKLISPNPNLVGKTIFTKFICDFPYPPIPLQCEFCSGPHVQSTCRFFIESKKAYHANPYLFLNGQENNFISHDILSINLGLCNESFSYESSHIIPDHVTSFDAFPFDDTFFENHFEQDHILSDEIVLEDK